MLSLGHSRSNIRPHPSKRKLLCLQFLKFWNRMLSAKQFVFALLVLTAMLCVIFWDSLDYRPRLVIRIKSLVNQFTNGNSQTTSWPPLVVSAESDQKQERFWQYSDANSSNSSLSDRVALTRATTTRATTTTTRKPLASLSGPERCAEIRRRVSHGVVDYALRDGDPELVALVQPLFTKRRLVVWSADHHIGPMSDLRSLLEPLGVEFLEHTLYHVCDIMCTCEQLHSMKVLTAQNIVHLSRPVIERFWSEYQRDADLNRADALLVSYSFSMIELYLHYNKSIIAVAPLRYDASIASDKDRWTTLNSNLRRLAIDVRNVIGANSHYDVHYMRYFSGLTVDYVPSFCAYTGEFYSPSRRSFLYSERRFGFNGNLGPYWNAKFGAHYKKLNANFTLEDYRKKYKRFYYSDIASHLGVVYIPYQVSIMSFFEQYRMNIPLFAPSLAFLVSLHRDYYAVYDRTTAGGLKPSARGSRLPAHPSMAHVPDPNDDFSEASIKYWLPLADFYHFPHLTYFESVEQLVDILHSIRMERLWQVSEEMRAYNRGALKEILRFWRLRLLAIAHFSPFHPE